MAHRNTAFAKVGYLSTWIGLYVTACYVLGCFIMARAVDEWAAIGVLLLAMSVYLLDRVKPADRWHDPADAVAHPHRHAFMVRHAGLIRPLVIALAIAAAACLWLVHPVAALGVPVSHAGMLVYGTIPNRPRPKDRLVIKNLAVAIAVAAVVFGLFILDHSRTHLFSVQVIALALMLVLHVFADAMLCDIDDIEADRQFGTRTIPNTFGRRVTWNAALVLQLTSIGIALAAVTSAQPAGDFADQHRAAVASLVVLAVLDITLAVVRPRAVRDIVDAHLPLAVAIGWLIGIA